MTEKLSRKFPQKFPWARMMQLGLGTLHLSPEQFWRSSPREIAGAFGAPPQTLDTKLLRQKLNEMMEVHPD
jgi:uncharacterized phage protein (TIGR02216 family)